MRLLKVKFRLLKVRSGYPPRGGVRVPPPLGGQGNPPGGVRVPPRGGSGYPPSPPGGYPAGGGTGYSAGGGPTSVVSKLQLSSCGVSWPYIALCPMELWVMLQSIMGVKKKKKKNYGMGTPPPPLWTDRLMDGQTRVKTLPSRRTTYAGGNYKSIALLIIDNFIMTMMSEDIFIEAFGKLHRTTFSSKKKYVYTVQEIIEWEFKIKTDCSQLLISC